MPPPFDGIPTPLATVIPQARNIDPGFQPGVLAAQIIAAAIATTINFFGQTPDNIKTAFGALIVTYSVEALCGRKIASLMGYDIKEYVRKRAIKTFAYIFIIAVFGGAAMQGHEWFLLMIGVSGLCAAQCVTMMATVKDLGNACGVNLESLEDLFQRFSPSKERSPEKKEDLP